MAQEINGYYEIFKLGMEVAYAIVGNECRPWEWSDAHETVLSKITYGSTYVFPVNFMCLSTESKLEPDLEKWAKMALDN